ncbi:Signal transduction histidine kinase [Brevibacterium sandarakinum]|uniref:histidine kinase n=1 Tax=Brevibacterium sandarakinum TaxID=629680 RepID=A0A1H1TGB8_BRESA|nr:sensor histidine kinase [Brevibacterium sandarakinum]SDS59302.1 Signal transduction histidine kinase [Brevibacterium sandarakinum]
MNQIFDSPHIDTHLDAHSDAHSDASPRPNTYPESVPRPAESLTQPHPHQAPDPTRSWWSRMWHNMGRDSVLVVPGFFISLIGFVVLITLFSVSIATFVIWIGALLLPLTLFVATGFANVSRARARQWGVPIAEVVHRSRARGFRGWIGAMAEGRRWLDLLFEAVFALPIRLVAFSVSVPWFLGALGGLTYFFWGRFLPEGNTELIELIVAASNDTSLVNLEFGTIATVQFITGLVLLLSFPFVLHAMARLEIAAITAGLAPGHEGATSAGKARAGDESGRDPDGAESVANPVTETMLTRAGGEGWFWLLSIFVGVVLVSVGWPVTATLYDSSTVLAMLVVLAQSAALVLAVRQPVLAIIVGVASAAAGIILTAGTSGLVWPWTVTSILALVFLHLIVGLRHSWLHLVLLWSLSTVVGGLSLALPHAGGLSGAMANAITTASLTAGVSAIAVVGNLWIRGRTQLATERRLSAEQLAKRQELEERNRIAQELHDVVAHSMSVISVQATTARYRLPELDHRSVDEFDSIAGSARQALNEMRGLLAILRGGRDADLAPQPMVDDIPDLVEATRSSGAEVELEFPTDAYDINPTSGLTAFRLVQEALSNALRHSPGAPVRVSVGTDGAQLSIGVVNGIPDATDAEVGRPNSSRPNSVQPDEGHPDVGRSATGQSVAGHLGGGFGLKGMRERVEALDGTLQVGPTAEGGFEVLATLPAN